MAGEIYVCEQCKSKSDRLKVCCGKKMISSRHIIKVSSNMCGCSE